MATSAPVRRLTPRLVYTPKRTGEARDVTRDVVAQLVSLSYKTFLGDKADAAEFTVEDAAGLWRGAWFPAVGDRFELELRLGDGAGARSLPCGAFSVDRMTATGPPSTVTIAGQSATVTAEMRRTRRTASWEDTDLAAVVADVAGRSGQAARYLTSRTVAYGRVEQLGESDTAFVSRLCREADLVCLVRTGEVVVADRGDLLAGAAVPAVEYATAKSFSLEAAPHAAYGAAEVSYWDPASRELVTHVERLSGAATGEVLRITERAESAADAAARAVAALRRANRRTSKGRVVVPGRLDLVAGARVPLSGFGAFDADVVVDQADHRFSKSSGYETTISWGQDKT